MKKIFILLILLAIILLNGYSKQSDFTLSNYFKTGIITKYTDTKCNNSLLPNVTINGSGNLLGESIYFENLELNNALTILQAKVEFFEYISDKDLTILYCSSPLVPKDVEVKDILINLQIATTDEYTVIGWPLILGSF